MLLGPSGCGKTTTLRMIGGHEHPTSGDIVLDGQSLVDLPPHKRPTTTVFQHFALFPHRSVLDNVSFGLKMEGVGKQERKEGAWTLRWWASGSLTAAGALSGGRSSEGRWPACS